MFVDLHEPLNKYAAPTELEERPRGVVGYKDDAPTELFKSIHGRNACAKREEALHYKPLGLRRELDTPPFSSPQMVARRT
jgi:hypothetical protein